MFRLGVGRLVAVAVAAASIAGVTWVLAAPALALPTIKCTVVSGTLPAGPITFSGCNHAPVTGTASIPLPGSILTGGGGLITWTNGGPPRTTKIKWVAHTTETDTDGANTCIPGTPELEVVGRVVADTTGAAGVGQAATAEICFNSGGNVSLEPGTTVKFR